MYRHTPQTSSTWRNMVMYWTFSPEDGETPVLHYPRGTKIYAGQFSATSGEAKRLPFQVKVL